jgi:hypothetical protein
MMATAQAHGIFTDENVFTLLVKLVVISSRRLSDELRDVLTRRFRQRPDLLILDPFQGIRVLAPAAFWKWESQYGDVSCLRTGNDPSGPECYDAWTVNGIGSRVGSHRILRRVVMRRTNFNRKSPRERIGRGILVGALASRIPVPRPSTEGD